MTNERTKTITVTPNFDGLTRGMLRDAREQANARLIFEGFEPVYQAQALRRVQRWFAPLAVALNAASSVVEIEQLRSLMTDILADIDQTAAAREDEL